MHSTRRDTPSHRLVTAVLLGVGMLALASCSAARGTDADAEAPAVTTERETIPLSPSSEVAPSATTTVAPTSVAPTTTEPSTTSAPTTAAPTTAAPTTRPPKSTTTTLPRNVESVKPMKVPLQPMGQSSGSETTRLQERLLELGLWVSAVDGTYGLTTTQAVMAFQKYLGLPATGSVDADTAAYLSALDVRPHGHTDTGNLIEVDKQRQLLFVVRDGRTQWTLNTSTGNGEEYTEPDKNTPGESITGVSLTPDGLYRVDRERPEGWWEGDLGEIYRPKYFRGGIAVHGSNSIPNYPASHGCVRLSVPAMDFFWDNDLMPMGTTVWVHEGV